MHNETLAITCLDASAKSVLVSASPLRGTDWHFVGAGVLLQDLPHNKPIKRDLETRIVHLVSLGVGIQGDNAPSAVERYSHHRISYSFTSHAGGRGDQNGGRSTN